LISRYFILLLCSVLVFTTACQQSDTGAPSDGATDITNPTGSVDDPVVPFSVALPSVESSNDNPPNQAKILLGRYIFYDKALSLDNSTSCASCHAPSQGFSDQGKPFSRGVKQQMGDRNAMALVNVAFSSHLIWDGRFKTLEEHAIAPILHPKEMGNGSQPPRGDTSSYGGTPTNNDTLLLFTRMRGGSGVTAEAIARRTTYTKLFKEAFGDTVITLPRIARAIAAFERTMISNQSPFDDYARGNKAALNDHAKLGLALFYDKTKTNCSNCHSGTLFTDNKMHSNGLYKYYEKDKGLFAITKKPGDDGVFKTPTLRNVAVSAPYMHDGSIDNLKDVIYHYNRGGAHNTNQDPLIDSLNLSDQEVAYIAEFLKSLTDTKFLTNPAFTNPWQP
ncbi:MAG TPA: cytochrome c peroxidase, partial [Candidatus Kapabacteria bacterium]